MIARRAIAVVVAVGLVVGAWLVRTRVIDDDDAEAVTPPATATTLVCVRDLQRVCESIDVDGIEVVVRDAGDTLDDLSTAGADELPLWLTLDPLPAMVEALRAGTRAEPVGWTTSELASSRLALVSPTAKTTALGAACPDEAERWPCLGELAATAWSDLDPGLTGQVRPAIAPVDAYAVGVLALGQAAAGWFGSGPIVVDDPSFFAWLRPIHRVSDAAQLSGGTPIRTLRTRPSAPDVAVGAVAELGPSPSASLGVTYAGPMTSADVVLAAPSGTDVPAGLAEQLSAALTADGWGVADAAPSGAVPPSTLLALAELWEDL